MTGGSKVFVDTPIIIYLVEKNPDFYQKVSSILSGLINEDVTLISTVLTLAEFEIKPRKHNRNDLLKMGSLTIRNLFHLTEINWDVAQISAILRSKYSSLRAIDSLQIACAISKQCESFLTNDKRLRIVKEINIQLIKNL